MNKGINKGLIFQLKTRARTIY